MKTETLQSLLTAKVLFDRARKLCQTEDRYTASAGLVVLQDALELVMYSVLVELAVDEEKQISNLNFKELLKKITINDINIPKLSTLDALNAQRRTVKHLGQLVEPVTVRGFLNAATHAINSMLEQCVGKKLDQIFLNELVEPGPVKDCITGAIALLRGNNYFDALVEIRKALFLEFDLEYAIDAWKDKPLGYDPGAQGLGFSEKRGNKAPYYFKDREWIARNVREPFDYIQYDIDRLRSDLMEWGINTQDFWNLKRLTPAVFQFKEKDEWVIRKEPKFFTEEVTKSLVEFCVDRAVSIVVKKQDHIKGAKWLRELERTELKVRMLRNQELYSKATVESAVQKGLIKNTIWRMKALIEGPVASSFYQIFDYNQEFDDFTWGYIPYDSCEFIDE